jgi:hypothetical protein
MAIGRTFLSLLYGVFYQIAREKATTQMGWFDNLWISPKIPLAGKIRQTP